MVKQSLNATIAQNLTSLNSSFTTLAPSPSYTLTGNVSLESPNVTYEYVKVGTVMVRTLGYKNGMNVLGKFKGEVQ